LGDTLFVDKKHRNSSFATCIHMESFSQWRHLRSSELRCAIPFLFHSRGESRGNREVYLTYPHASSRYF